MTNQLTKPQILTDEQFEEWYEWFTNMLGRKSNVAEKNAIRGLAENTFRETLKMVRVNLVEILCRGTWYQRDKALANYIDSLNQLAGGE